MKKSKPRNKITRQILSYVSLFLCLTLTRFTIEGKQNVPKKGPFILAPNHIDDVDPVPVSAAIRKPITFLMAEDQAKLPWYKAWGPWSYGVVLVNRKKVQISSIKQIQKQIKKGERICIFPEGTSKDVDKKSGKRGVAYFAIKNKIPIIPVSISGTKGIIKKILKIKREQMNIVFGNPIFVKKEEKEEQLTKRVMAAINKSL